MISTKKQKALTDTTSASNAKRPKATKIIMPNAATRNNITKTSKKTKERTNITFTKKIKHNAIKDRGTPVGRRTRSGQAAKRMMRIGGKKGLSSVDKDNNEDTSEGEDYIDF